MNLLFIILKLQLVFSINTNILTSENHGEMYINQLNHKNSIDKIRENVYRSIYQGILDDSTQDLNKISSMSNKSTENVQIKDKIDDIEQLIDKNQIAEIENFFNNEQFELEIVDSQKYVSDLKSSMITDKIKNTLFGSGEPTNPKCRVPAPTEIWDCMSEDFDFISMSSGFHEELPHVNCDEVQNFLEMPDITDFIDNLVNGLTTINENILEIIEVKLNEFFKTLEEYSDCLYKFTLQVFDKARKDLQKIIDTMFVNFHEQIMLSLCDRIKDDIEDDIFDKIVINIDEIIKSCNEQIKDIMAYISYDAEKINNYIIANAQETYCQLKCLLKNPNFSCYSQPMYLNCPNIYIRKTCNETSNQINTNVKNIMDGLKRDVNKEITDSISLSENAKDPEFVKKIQNLFSQNIDDKSNKLIDNVNQKLDIKTKENIEKISSEFDSRRNSVNSMIKNMFNFVKNSNNK